MEQHSRLRPEFAVNPESRVACVLLLDTSSSMSGAPIRSLNAALRMFKEQMLNDKLASLRTEVAVVSFDNNVRLVTDFVTIDNFDPPELTAQGQTFMGAAIDMAIDIVDERIEIYKANGIAYYRPWVFMITDGEPQGEPRQVVDGASARIKEKEDSKKVAFFAVGVGGANIDRLREIVNKEPSQLRGLNFSDLFVWLSRSMQSISHAETDAEMIPLPDDAGWSRVENRR